MSDRDAFLRAIRANPDDDTPRLVFADWLDERSDPLGELIRVQIELEPVREHIDRPRVRELLDRESDLLGRHGPEWVGRAADLDAAHPGFGPVFRRGLPELVCLSLDNFLSRGDELFADCPTVREVSLFGIAGRGAELAACPHLANVETLEIADPVYTLFPQETARLCESMRGAKARCLRVPGSSNPPFCYPHLVHRLAYEFESGWPLRVEFMTYHHEEGLRAERDAAALNQQAGRPVAQVIRPSEALFPLMGDLGYGFVAGRTRDGAGVLFVPVDDNSSALAFFMPDGSLDDVDELHEPVRWHVENQTEGFTPAFIRVHDFPRRAGLSIYRWPQSYITDYLMRSERPAGWTDEAWTNRGGVLRRWLQQGRFVIEWDGREFWADSSGTIFSA